MLSHHPLWVTVSSRWSGEKADTSNDEYSHTSSRGSYTEVTYISYQRAGPTFTIIIYVKTAVQLNTVLGALLQYRYIMTRSLTSLRRMSGYWVIDGQLLTSQNHSRYATCNLIYHADDLAHLLCDLYKQAKLSSFYCSICLTPTFHYRIVVFV